MNYAGDAGPARLPASRKPEPRTDFRSSVFQRPGPGPSKVGWTSFFTFMSADTATTRPARKSVRKRPLPNGKTILSCWMTPSAAAAGYVSMHVPTRLFPLTVPGASPGNVIFVTTGSKRDFSPPVPTTYVWPTVSIYRNRGFRKGVGIQVQPPARREGPALV